MILLRQRQFARADYAGLSEEAAKKLRQQRSQAAKDLLKRRQEINTHMDAEIKRQNPVTLTREGNTKTLEQLNKESMGRRNAAYQQELNNTATKAKSYRTQAQQSTHAKEAWKEIGKKAQQEQQGFLSKNMQRAGRLFKGTSKYGKAGQIAAIGTTALGVGALGYGTYKAVKNKKNQ